jgi:hypothetical protein
LWDLLVRLAAPLGALSIEVLLERDLTAPIAPIGAELDLSLREATDQDLDWITPLYARDPYLYLGETDPASGKAVIAGKLAATEQYRARLRRGEKCFVASAGSEVAHVNWICFGWGEAIPGHPIVLRPGEVYTTDAFTIEKFRGRNVHAAVLGEMMRYAQRAGYRTAYTLTRTDRHSSFHALRELGWRVRGRLVCFVPRGARRAWVLRLSGRVDCLYRDPIAGGAAPRADRMQPSP